MDPNISKRTISLSLSLNSAKMQTSRLLSFSSTSQTFESFSTTVDLTAIAARVVDEFQNQNPHSDPNDDDFAFDCPSQPIATADEIFSNGKIRPLNPYGESKPTEPRRRRPALRKLMSEELDSKEEDLIGVSPESYCVWKPKQSNGEGDDVNGVSTSPLRSKIKSNSVGFSKRWKLRNILYARSSSEGGENKTTSFKEEEREREREREEMKRQEFVPYKKDMIGILKNVNGLSRHLRPF